MLLPLCPGSAFGQSGDAQALGEPVPRFVLHASARQVVRHRQVGLHSEQLLKARACFVELAQLDLGHSEDAPAVCVFAVLAQRLPGQHERFRLPRILANRFGRWYVLGTDKSVSGRVVVEGKAALQRRAGGR